MVEVFKTSVTNRKQANILLSEIHSAFANYKANFDLEDCDHILRIECSFMNIEVNAMINLLGEFGFYAEVLPDEVINETAFMIK
ncbi:MAG: hypothetical protein JWQ25_278 [Daejeonella sp.]|nr:hypothetical protein [Daejeonella sp.]